MSTLEERWDRHARNVEDYGENAGLCVECGTQCVALGCAVACPNPDCPQNQ